MIMIISPLQLYCPLMFGLGGLEYPIQSERGLIILFSLSAHVQDDVDFCSCVIVYTQLLVLFLLY